MNGESFEWGWPKVSVVRGGLEEIVHIMDRHNFAFLIQGGARLNPAGILRPPSIMLDLWLPSQDPSKDYEPTASW